MWVLKQGWSYRKIRHRALFCGAARRGAARRLWIFCGMVWKYGDAGGLVRLAGGLPPCGWRLAGGLAVRY